MKVTYLEEIENRTAFSRKMFCPCCGSHMYQIVRQVEPIINTPWYIRCEECKTEGPPAFTKGLAIVRWKQINI